MSAFDVLDNKLRKSLRGFGFTYPTGPQEKAIPKIVKGYNTLIVAPTGSGKTEAAVFPILNGIIKLREQGEVKSGVQALYITPLKSLNRDILKRLIKLGESLAISIEVRHGDTSHFNRRRQAITPPDILIITPETLQAILPGKRIRQHLKTVKWVVVDEIHELANDERGAQLAIGLERLVLLTGKRFQRIGLSATVGNVSKVARFLAGNNEIVKIVYFGGRKKFIAHIDYTDVSSEDYELASILKSTPKIARTIQTVAKLIEQHKSVLLFTNTREAAEVLASKLRIYDPSFKFAVHHSSLSREVRLEAEAKFKDETIKCIICTSSLELGIDIGAIDFVIQFMSPRQVSKLIQRIGRAGHKLERASEGYIITINTDDILEAISICKGMLKNKIEEVSVQENSLDVLCHQIAGITIENDKIEFDLLCRIIRKTYPYRQITVEKIKSVIDYLNYQKLVYSDGTSIKRRRSTLLYYYSNLSMIPDVKQYSVIDITANRAISKLDEEFVVNNEEGTVFIAKGQAWKIISIEEDAIKVEPIPSPTAAVPSWEGDLLPVPYLISRNVGLLRELLYEALSGKNKSVSGTGWLRNFILSGKSESEHIVIEENALKKLSETFEFYTTNNKPYSGVDDILIENMDNVVIVHLCYGTKINQTVAQLIAALLSSRYGQTIGVKSDPYRIIIQHRTKINSEDIKNIFYEIQAEHIKPILEKTLKQSALFNWKYVYVAKRFGLIEKDADYNTIDIKRLIRFGHPVIYEETMREIFLEKLDLAGTIALFNKIHQGKAIIKTSEAAKIGEPGEFTRIALDNLGVRDLVSPEKPISEILEVLKRRLYSTRKKLVCLYCGKFESTREVGSLEEYPSCRICGSRYLAAVYPNDDESYSLVRRYKGGEQLSKSELQKIKKLQDIGSLILTMGRKAIMVLAGRGIGLTNAKRIFSKTNLTEYDILTEVLRTEKKYIETRGFWD